MQAIAPQNSWDYWSTSEDAVCFTLESNRGGLSSVEAAERLERYGKNELGAATRFGPLWTLWNQLRNPLLLLLVFAATVSLLIGEWVDGLLVVVILTVSVGIGFFREHTAQTAAAALQRQIAIESAVLRDGRERLVPVSELAPGDVVLLSAGSLVPADGRLLQAEHFFVNESVLTGESFPVEKQTEPSAPDSRLAERRNCVYLGSNVRSGSARFIVCRTGRSTEYGAIAGKLKLRPPETEFERGLRLFGEVLTAAMFIMVMLVLGVNVLMGRPFLETLLFSVALAVGLSPELLPAILSVNLARGAIGMSRHGVLVRHLDAIENLGSMDVLCTDKTGTLTEGVIRLQGAFDLAGNASADVLEIAAKNSALQTGYSNPLDSAILESQQPKLDEVKKLAEIPYDFVRKRLSVVVEDAQGVRLLTKGAYRNVMDCCGSTSDGRPLGPHQRKLADQMCEQWNRQGVRVLAVASKRLPKEDDYAREDETNLTFQGFLTFVDHPKGGVREMLARLSEQGVSVKLISGDSGLVCRHVAGEVGLPAKHILSGAEIDELTDPALWHRAEKTDLFVEVDPNQKERIILAIKKMGHVVGFLGDGVNDAPAMHAADTSLSVQQAVDVARAAADFVLLQPDLSVVSKGIEEGRTTFANTLKYIRMAGSANLGNMISMAAASLFLPFLPLLGGQVLLNNFLSDIPAFALAEDRVDPEMIERPRRWSIRQIVFFMLLFGLLSSAFDFLTFATLIKGFHSSEVLFRTGWFVESLITQLAVALVIRTWRPCFSSRPARPLLISTVVIGLLAIAIPYLPIVDELGFQPLPVGMLASVLAIAAAYVASAETLKRATKDRLLVGNSGGSRVVHRDGGRMLSSI